MRETKEFTRQELYDLVWSTPIVKLAKEFGLSDVGFRKTCVRYRVPTPPPGYWAKLNFDKPVKKTPLPPPDPVLGDRVLVSVFERTELSEEVVEAEARARQQLSLPIVVPDELPARLHRAVQALKKALGSAQPDDEGFLWAGGPTIPSVSIGPANCTRAVLIIDTLFKAMEAAGQSVEATDAGLVVKVDGECLSLRVRETKDKKAHEPTKSELKAKAEWELNHQKWPALYDPDRGHWRRWDFFPSGRLTLTLTDPQKSRWQDGRVLGRWYDRKTSKLEAYVGDVLVGMLTGSATVRHNRIAAEAQKRRREEAHEAHLKEQERRRYEAQVDAFIEAKADEFARLRKILAFRDYVARESSAARSHEEEAIIHASNDLIGRLQRGLAAESLKQAVKRL